MRIASFEHRYLDGVLTLWNAAAVAEDYKELDAASFDRIFLSNPYYDPANAFVLLDEHGAAQGFACGCTGDDLPLGDVAGYITCIALAEAYRNDGAYGMLLGALEARFRELGKKQADVLFFNPMMLPWYVPGTPKHEHNNAPGVPVGSPFHVYLLAHGYAERTQECAMYLNLSDFDWPDEMRSKEAKANAEGYEVELFDPQLHNGIEAMLVGFDNPLWQREIAQCAVEGVPVVIAAQGGKAVGFAGPVIRQDNGRGYFAGIGVHPDHEGHGLGSLLFFRLCEAFRAIGTDYMSLYTGIKNPAIRIYEKAGFKTVKHFAIMRREF
ncbi:GNAT family N-acetyltransferase [Paenibacillus sacheonensis]|uniref:GNAT family N-acetyltransferase n=1 Tax=Paenibacillus sacheonensis TaxID=742054 RepID=A0A7X5C0D7_9BACL|nr:GNAT family N-acetyltransferase [Paenibacillus sacheonensis]MBM7566839.1 ribosomal protein S18 acetylase RimI-like enzyme [Paenibacillus sacheonensis]NBC71461.1 GNAT family N-acetyltransferase [Paenibacillus sacheonensis]